MRHVNDLLRSRLNMTGLYPVTQSILFTFIKGIYIDADGRYLVLVLGDKSWGEGELFYAILEAVGDCCSMSWIEQLSGIGGDKLLSHITSFDSVELQSNWLSKEDPEEDSDVVLEQYCYRISTGGGAIDIELRNESNGYYGGELEWVVEKIHPSYWIYDPTTLFCKITGPGLDHYPVLGHKYEFNLSFKDIVGKP